MNHHDVRSLVHDSQREAHGILSLGAACDDMYHFREPMGLDNLGSAIAYIRFRHGEDNRVDDRRRLEDA
jgi:hypothetical protein